MAVQSILWVAPVRPGVTMGTNRNFRGRSLRGPRQLSSPQWPSPETGRVQELRTRSLPSLPSPTMRLLHTMLRVGDLDRSIAFYTELLGMRLLRRSDNSQYRYTLAFVGYGDEADTAVLELTYNWDTDHYELGTAFGHLAISCPDIVAICETIRSRGGKVVREPGPVLGGSTVIAFVEDPDGYRIELIERRTPVASPSPTDPAAA